MGLLHSPTQRTALDLVRFGVDVTAPEIASKLGVETATALYLLNDLRKLQLVKVRGRKPSGPKGGKPARCWVLDTPEAQFLGIELRLRSVRCVLVNFKGELIESEEVLIPKKAENGSKLADTIQTLATWSNKWPGIEAAAISPSNAVNKKMDRNELREFQRKLALEANTISAGIWTVSKRHADLRSYQWFSNRIPSPRNFCFLRIRADLSSVQVGGLQSGKIIDGDRGLAGDSVRFIAENEWLLIYRQLAEQYSGRSIPLRMTSAGIRPVNLLEKLDENLEQELLDMIIERYAAKLGFLIDLLDPELVVLGHEFEQYSKDLPQLIREHLKDKTIEVVLSPHAKFSTAWGAAAYAIHRWTGGETNEH
jgi:predicted NBD/HSP70 family sugar kinase